MNDKDKELWLELLSMKSEDVLEEYEKAVRFRHYDYNMETPRYSLDMLREFILNGLENAH